MLGLDLDDTSSFNGLGIFGVLIILFAFGFGGYFAYSIGYQKGLDNAGKCLTSKTPCKIIEKEIGSAKYKIIEK
ncbi:TPA: hypothetical protein ACGIK9_003349 [Acinetobacter baumannii]|uniref:hypothetical protein n=1 Tax=Acinetobacter baumannii TaxID=470 RepID=UPI00338E0B72